MIKYIIKRVLIGVLTLFILATITFFGVHYMPGNPFEQDNKRMTQAQYDSLNAKYGLDKPLGTQYMMFLKNAAKYFPSAASTHLCTTYFLQVLWRSITFRW